MPGRIGRPRCGHTKGVRAGDALASKTHAEMPDDDLVEWAAGVEEALQGVAQHEFDSMVSLAFNIGMGYKPGQRGKQ